MTIARTDSEELISSKAVFRNSRWYAKYPLSRISHEAVQMFYGARASMATYTSRGADRLLKVLDCYLCVTNQRLTVDDLARPNGGEIFRGFIGAVYSEAFYFGDAMQRYSLVSQLHSYVACLAQTFRSLETALSGTTPMTVSISPEILSLVCMFEERELDPIEVKIWRAWPISTSDRAVIAPDLRPILVRYGSKFTDSFFDAIEECAIRTRKPRMDYVPFLVRFLADRCPEDLKAEFLDAQICSVMWRVFQHFFVESREHTSQYRATANIWRSFRCFWTQHLSRAGIFSSKASVPYLPGGSAHPTHIVLKGDGIEVSEKLLTDIPLHISDREAIETLFGKIQSDIDIVERWALAERSSIWARYLRRRQFEKLGDDVTFPCHRGSIPEHPSPENDYKGFLMNACATFRIRGYIPSSNGDFYYPKPFKNLAFDLGLPRSDDLLPHMALLVHDHPELTGSFFSDCELYDVYGQMVGVEKRDSGVFLNGYKHRKGPSRAFISVMLSTRGSEIVEQVIALTEPLREYLKNRGDDMWRRLFLTCQRGFGRPTVVNPAGSASNVESRKKLEESFAKFCGLRGKETAVFVDRFSLAALRASVGVVTYVKDPDVRKLALKLGHTRYDHKLVAIYLPEPLLRFFQQRWMRLFQVSLVAEALKDSDSLLYATGLKDMEEVHKFLTNHALRVRRSDVENEDFTDSTESSNREFMFLINEEVLSVMLKVVEDYDAETASASPLRKYWAGVSKEVIARIERPGAVREDLIYYLLSARKALSGPNKRGGSYA